MMRPLDSGSRGLMRARVIIALLVCLTLTTSISAQGKPNPGHSASEIWGGTFNGKYGNFTFPNDLFVGIPSNTSCADYTTDGQICWDSDDDILYIGDGGAQPVRINDANHDLYLGEASGTDTDAIYFFNNTAWDVDYLKAENMGYFNMSTDLWIYHDLYLEPDDLGARSIWFNSQAFTWSPSNDRFNIAGHVGIGNIIHANVTMVIQIGDSLGTVWNGQIMAQGDYYPGMIMGEDIDNRAFTTWDYSGNYAQYGTVKSGSTATTMYLKGDKVGLNGVPQEDLDIYESDDADTNTTLRLHGTSSDNIDFYETTAAAMRIEYEAAANRILFVDLTTGTDEFSFYETGNVGINNNGPDADLHVTGGVCIDDNTVCTDPGAGNLDYQTYLRGGPGSVIRMGVYNACSGINTNCLSDIVSPPVNHSSDPQDLYIQGELEDDLYLFMDKLTTSYTSARFVYYDQGGRNHLYYVPSSRRYKDNITDLDDDFEKALGLRPRSFEWKETGVSDFGYIAEEVDELGLTRLVGYVNETAPDAVYYEKVGVYVLELVKEHEARLEALDNDINRLKEAIEAKKAELTALEAAQ